MKKIFFVFFLVCLFCAAPYSQDTKTEIPGKHYESGWLHNVFFGSHWRDVWAAPVKMRILDLKAYGGGLTPQKRGGGLETISLKFKGENGETYKFRSLDKDPKNTLPPDLQGSIAQVIVQDQISSSMPYACLVVNPLLDAVGIYHPQDSLYILPDDPKLGEFRKEFANMIGFLELVPKEYQFEGSDKVIDCNKLLANLDKKFDEFVDSKEFLKARLMDIFLGDWDRHKDQWLWIRYEQPDGKKLYKPFPVDRDQAFSKFDGLLPSIAESIIPQFNNFGKSYPDMLWMTWSGRYIDQRFLGFLTKSEWDEVTDFVNSKLTDAVINDAVKQLPREIYILSKDELIEKLKSRRNELKEASNEYYGLVNSIVDIYTTNKNDYVEISFNGNKTDVSVYKLDKSTGEKEPGVLRNKSFDNNITGEIRLYLQDGKDKCNISGNGNNTPKVRVVGSHGKDAVKNTSGINVLFYDDNRKSKISGDISFDNENFLERSEKLELFFSGRKNELSSKDRADLQKEINSPKNKKLSQDELLDNLKYNPVNPPEKFGTSFFSPYFNYNPDAGSLIGFGYHYDKYDFRQNPYSWKLQTLLAYAPDKKGLTGLLADLTFQTYGLIKNTESNLHFKKSGIEVNNYFGFGNETPYNETLSKAKYYNVLHEEYFVNPNIVFPRNKYWSFNAGALVKYFDVKSSANTSYNDAAPYGGNKLSLLAGELGFTFDKRDHPTAPYSGAYFNINGGYFPKAFNNLFQFGNVIADARAYIGYKEYISLALRAKGEKLWGTYPFFESAYIGGKNGVRGFSSERFAGDASLLGSAELRIRLFKMFLLLPETIGIYGFGESGRVFLNGENSKLWHTGYGGGLFMHLVNRDITFHLTYAKSVERNVNIYFGTGFSF